MYVYIIRIVSFNTQPPEGGCLPEYRGDRSWNKVSTHSHPKVAAKTTKEYQAPVVVSTHSHPKVAASDRWDR